MTGGRLALSAPSPCTKHMPAPATLASAAASAISASDFFEKIVVECAVLAARLAIHAAYTDLHGQQISELQE
jgi:hypothetical protein